MREIQTILLLISILFTISKSDICSEIKEQSFYIRQAFRLNDSVVVFTSNNTVYRLNGFNFSGNLFTHSSIDEVTNWSNWQKKLKYIFTVNYPQEGIRTVVITWDTKEDIDQFVGYLYQFDGSVANVVTEREINVNIYKNAPDAEPLGLYSLFTKLPQKDLQFNMKSIMSFPLNEPTVVQRVFTYYLEIPPKNQSNAPNVFKRHIFMEKNATHGSIVAPNWVYDIPSNKCISSDVIVNSSLALTDYTRTGNDLSFSILEFSGKQYFVREVTISNSIVSHNLTIQSSGPLDWVFGCSVPSTVLTSVTTMTTIGMTSDTTTTTAGMTSVTTMTTIGMTSDTTTTTAGMTSVTTTTTTPTNPSTSEMTSTIDETRSPETTTPTTLSDEELTNGTTASSDDTVESEPSKVMSLCIGILAFVVILAV